MPPAEDDPAAIESVAVSREDLVTAYEHALRGGDGRAVLRLTPPFHARMRARIHMEPERDDDEREQDPTDAADSTDAEGPTPIHLPPERLIDAERAPDPPTPDETEDALRADPRAEYSVERHRDRHAAAMDEWRAAVGAAARERVEIETPAGPREIAVKVLGSGAGSDGPGSGGSGTGSGGPGTGSGGSGSKSDGPGSRSGGSGLESDEAGSESGAEAP